MSATADAIGRTVRIVIVEDRDFRSAADAQTECDKLLADRERRNVAMRGWITWGRNEIENYFLDEAVLVPAMTAAYRCSEADVLKALDAAIALLCPFQALQGAVAEVRREWEATEPSSLIVASRPSWTAAGLQVVDAAQVERDLTTACGRWRDRFVAAEVAKEPFLGQRVVASFKQRLAACSSVTRASPDWLNDWAGKEILKLVRQQLANVFEGPAREPDRRVPPVQWHGFRNNNERNTLDREIERALQPALVKALWDHTVTDAAAPMRQNLDRLLALLQH